MTRPTCPRHRRLACITVLGALAAGCADGLAAEPDAAANASPAAAAVIDGRLVPLAQVLEPVQQQLRDRDRQHAAARAALDFRFGQAREQTVAERLDRYVDDAVLDLEARAQHSSAAALLAAIKPPAVSDAEAREAFDRLKAHVKESYAEVEAKLKGLIAEEGLATLRRAYLDGLRRKYRAAVLREPLRVAVPGGGAARGPDDAPVTIVEFADFQCPFCGRLEVQLRRLLAEHPRDVRLVFRQLPLPRLHPLAEGAARTAVCADRQHRFWELHDWMFDHQEQLDFDSLRQAAPSVGIDAERLFACLENERPEDAIAVDTAVAADIGLTSTPATFVNGRFIDGAVPYGELLRLVDEELVRARPAPTGR